MKRIFTFFISTLIACAAFAGFNDGKITITHLGLQSMSVEIDGKNYGNNDRLIMINNLSAGYHSVKVYYQRNNGSDRWDDRNNSKAQLVYSGRVKLKANYHVDIVINRFGKALIDERPMDSKYSKDYGRDSDYSYFDNDRRRDNDNRYDDRNNDRDRRDNIDRNDRIETRKPAQPMQDQTFAALMETLKKDSFESTRLKLAKQVIEQHNFMSLQVKQLLKLFTYEESRLDLAKFMYGITIDRENYFQLYDSFTYSASREDLSSYVRAYR